MLLSFAVRLEFNISPIMGIQISDRTNTTEQRSFEQFQFFVYDLASTAKLKARKKHNVSDTCNSNSQSNVSVQKCANSASLVVVTIVVLVQRMIMDAWRCIAGYVNIEESKNFGCLRPITRLSLVFHVLTL